ncbi:MAG: LysR family transcriptional regulator [Candidatus Krumholzibacteriota bacterium]|nr:LysR family transcriptional regulator [Candidatus Krumholzibacteriota bacterium]
MEIRQLRYFLSTVKHGSLRAAAREHFVTQPAVSIQLKKLEDELGEKLYVRRGRRIEPTQAGSAVLAGAEEILGRIDALAHHVGALKTIQRGVLKMGSIDAASIYVLPGVFRAFRRRYPGIDVQVIVSDSHSLLAELGAGTIELAVVTLPLPGESYGVVPIYEDRMVLVAQPRHELAGLRGAGVLERVAETGLITYPARSTTRRLIEKVFLDNGLTPRVTMEMSSPEAIKKLAEAGLGPSILPAAVVANEVRRGTLVVVPTGKVRFSRTLGVVLRDRERLSPPAGAFLEMVKRKTRRRRSRA